MASVSPFPVALRIAGESVFEETLVRRAHGDALTIVRSPGLILGLAAGDQIRAGADGSWELVSRGGNVAVHVYDASPRLQKELSNKFEDIGGRLDGAAKQLLVYTVPVSVGFEAIERVLRCVPTSGKACWAYSNVYDDDGRPLGWWTAFASK